MNNKCYSETLLENFRCSTIGLFEEVAFDTNCRNCSGYGYYFYSILNNDTKKVKIVGNTLCNCWLDSQKS